MATVAAIFDDSVALDNAVSRLHTAGLGDDRLRLYNGVAAEAKCEPGIVCPFLA